MESAAAPVGETERLEISAAADAPATERLRATTMPMRPAAGPPAARRFSWGAIAGTAGIVFVLALLFITAVELISGQPLSAIFGGADTGTTLHNLITPPPATTTTSSTTTTTTGPSTTTATDRPEHDVLDGERDTDVLRDFDDHDDGRGCDDVDDHDVAGGRYQPLNSAGRRSTKLATPSLESSVLVSSSCPMASS